MVTFYAFWSLNVFHILSCCLLKNHTLNSDTSPLYYTIYFIFKSFFGPFGSFWSFFKVLFLGLCKNIQHYNNNISLFQKQKMTP